MPVTTLNDLKESVSVSGVSGAPTARMIRTMHDLVGERLAGRQVIDAQVLSDKVVHFEHGPLKPGETHTERARSIIWSYQNMQQFLKQTPDSDDLSFTVDMGDGALHVAPDASGLVPPPKIISAYAESQTALRVTIAASASLVGKRVCGPFLEPYYAGLMVEICPQNLEGKWMVSARNGVACTMIIPFAAFTQKTTQLNDWLIPLDKEHPNSAVFDSFDVHKVVVRVSWSAVVAAVGAAPTKDTVCAAVMPESSSEMIDVNEALFDIDAVPHGGGREIAAVSSEFHDPQGSKLFQVQGEGAAGSSSDPPPREESPEESVAAKRRKRLEAAEARMRASSAE